MTSLADLFGGPQPPPTPEQRAAEEAEHQRRHAEMDAGHNLMAFWAPLLCGCRMWPERGNTRPPQEDCMIHGHVGVNPCSGVLYLPGVPVDGKPHPE